MYAKMGMQNLKQMMLRHSPCIAREQHLPASCMWGIHPQKGVGCGFSLFAKSQLK